MRAKNTMIGYRKRDKPDSPKEPEKTQDLLCTNRDFYDVFLRFDLFWGHSRWADTNREVHKSHFEQDISAGNMTSTFGLVHTKLKSEKEGEDLNQIRAI